MDRHRDCVRAKGKDVVHFATGVPHLSTSKHKPYARRIRFSVGEAPLELRKEIIEFMKANGRAAIRL